MIHVLKTRAVVLLMILGLVIGSMLAASPKALASDLSLCSVSGAKPVGQINDMDGHPNRVKGYGTFSCPFRIIYSFRVYVERMDTPTAIIRDVTVTGDTLVPYGTYPTSIYSGCDAGSGTYRTKAILTEDGTGNTKTYTSTNTNLSLDCPVYGGPDY